VLWLYSIVCGAVIYAYICQVEGIKAIRADPKYQFLGFIRIPKDKLRNHAKDMQSWVVNAIGVEQARIGKWSHKQLLFSNTLKRAAIGSGS
jgi:hypothetical protein